MEKVEPQNVEYVSEQLDVKDPALEAFSNVFARFQLPPETATVRGISYRKHFFDLISVHHDRYAKASPLKGRSYTPTTTWPLKETQMRRRRNPCRRRKRAK